MVDVVQALAAYGEVGQQVVDLLYGDDAYEIKKALASNSQTTNNIRRTPSLNPDTASSPTNFSNNVARAAGVSPPPQTPRVQTPRVQTPRVQTPNAQTPNVRPPSPNTATRTTRLPRPAQQNRPQQRSLRPRPVIAKSTGPFQSDVSFTVPAKGRLVKLSMTKKKKKFLDTDDKKRKQRKKDDEVEKCHDVEWRGTISKMDNDKRQVFGWASVTSIDGVPVKDLQGDEIDIEEIEKAAYDYVTNSRRGGNMHRRIGEDPLHVSDMIESFVVTPEKKALLGISKSMPEEGWWVGFQINDEETWADAKAGNLAEFSIHGSGKRSS